MPSDTYGRAVRSLLLVIVFQLGCCLIVLAEVANAVRGYNEPLPFVAQLIGGVTVVGAIKVLLEEPSE